MQRVLVAGSARDRDGPTIRGCATATDGDRPVNTKVSSLSTRAGGLALTNHVGMASCFCILTLVVPEEWLKARAAAPNLWSLVSVYREHGHKKADLDPLQQSPW